MNQVTIINVWNSNPEQILEIFKGIPLSVEAVWAQNLRAYMVTVNIEDQKKVFDIIETIDQDSVIICEVYMKTAESDEIIAGRTIESRWEVS
jgi:hypothetical protein